VATVPVQPKGDQSVNALDRDKREAAPCSTDSSGNPSGGGANAPRARSQRRRGNQRRGNNSNNSN
ncbi:unnamed protein product, partial [Oppiella nova]